MIVIYGTRQYGKVDQRDGQYAVTRFAHIYWMPLFPVASHWMTRPGYGHPMKLSGKSVVAGYARAWGPLAAVLGLVAGGPVGWLVAAGAVGATGASWMWKDLRGDAAKRESDLNERAFGTRCNPRKLPRALVRQLEPGVNDRWAQCAGGETPSDVARFGTEDARKAAAAYGVLRLSARSLPRAQASEAEQDARRIIERSHDKPALGDGGPYRELPEQPVP